MSTFNDHVTGNYSESGEHNVSVVTNDHYAVEKVTVTSGSGTEQTITGGETVEGSLNTGLKRATASNPVEFTASTNNDYYVHGKPIKYKVTVNNNNPSLGYVYTIPSEAKTTGVIEGSSPRAGASGNGVCTFANWTGDIPSGQTSTDSELTYSNIDADKSVTANFNCVVSVVDPLHGVVRGGNATWVTYNGTAPRSKRCDFFKYGYSSSDTTQQQNACNKPYLRMVSSYYKPTEECTATEYTITYTFRCGDKAPEYTATPTPTTSNSIFLTTCNTYQNLSSVTKVEQGGYSCQRDTSTTQSIYIQHEHCIYPEQYPEYVFTDYDSVYNSPSCSNLFDNTSVIPKYASSTNTCMFQKVATAHIITYTLAGQSNFPRYYPETVEVTGNYITKLDGCVIDDESPEYITYYHDVNGTVVATAYERVLDETIYIKKYTGTRLTETETMITNPNNAVLRYDEKDCGEFHGWYTFDGSNRDYVVDGEGNPVRNLTLDSDSCCNRYYIDQTTCDDAYYPYGIYTDQLYRPAYILTNETVEINEDTILTYENLSYNLGNTDIDNGSVFALQPNTTVYGNGFMFLESVLSGAEYVISSGTLLTPVSSGAGYKTVDKFVNNTSSAIYYKKYYVAVDNFIIDSNNDSSLVAHNRNELELVVNSTPLYFITDWNDSNYPFYTINSNRYYDHLVYMATCAVNKSVAFMTCKNDGNSNSLNYLLDDPSRYRYYGWFYDDYTLGYKKYEFLGPTYDGNNPLFLDGRVLKLSELQSTILRLDRDGTSSPSLWYYQGGVYQEYTNIHSGYEYPNIIYQDQNAESDITLYSQDYEPSYTAGHYIYSNGSWISAAGQSSGDTYTMFALIMSTYQWRVLKQADGVFQYSTLPYVNSYTDLENAFDEEYPYFVKPNLDSYVYGYETYDSYGLYALTSDTKEFDSSDQEYAILFDEYGDAAPLDILVQTPTQFDLMLDASRSYIYTRYGDEIQKEFYCDIFGCDKNGYFIGLPNLDYSYNVYRTGRPWIDDINDYEVSPDAFGNFYVSRPGYFNGVDFYESLAYFKITHTDVYSQISNNILDNITTTKLTGTDGISYYALTAPVEMSGGSPAQTDYNYVKYNGTPSSSYPVASQADLTTALNAHQQYIHITSSFHIQSGVNRGVRYIQGDYYELHSNPYYTVYNPEESTNRNLSFVGWIVQGTTKLGFYCDRNGQTEAGIIEYPVTHDYEICPECNQSTNVQQIYTKYPTYSSTTYDSSYTTVYGLADLIRCFETAEDFTVESGYDISYNGETYTNNTSYYVVSDGYTSLTEAYAKGIPYILINSNADAIERNGRLFIPGTYYKSTLTDILIYDEETLNRAKVDSEHEFFVIADYTLADECPGEALIVEGINDLKAAIAANVEYIIPYVDIYYNGMVYGNDICYKRCVMTIEGHMYNPGDILVKKTEKKFYPKDITVKAQKCETCVAVYAYQFSLSFCRDTACLPGDWSNGLALFYDGARMAWVGIGAMFDHTLFTEGHTLTPYIDTTAWSDGTECLSIDGYHSNCVSSNSLDHHIVCPPPRINDFTYWLDDIFNSCDRFNYHVRCRRYCNVNDVSKIGIGYEYEYLRYGDTYYKWNNQAHAYRSTDDTPSTYHIIYSDYGYDSITYPEAFYRKFTRGLYRVSVTSTTLTSLDINSTAIFSVSGIQTLYNAFRSFAPVIHVTTSITTEYQVLLGYYLVSYESVSLETQYSIDGDTSIAHLLLYDNTNTLVQYATYSYDATSVVIPTGCFGMNIYFESGTQ